MENYFENVTFIFSIFMCRVGKTTVNST